MPKRPLKMEEILPGEWRFGYPSKQAKLIKRLIDAVSELERGDLDGAEAKLRGLIDQHPPYIDGRHFLALVLFNKKLYDEALALWREAVELGISSLPERFVMGTARLEWLWPENRPFLRAYAWLGLALKQQGEAKEALAIFRNLLALDPGDHQGIRASALEVAFAGKLPEVVLEICGQFPADALVDVVYARPLALLQTGRKEEAEKGLARAIEDYPLVARELIKKRHLPVRSAQPGYIEVGGADEAYLYWLKMGKYWKGTLGALDLVKVVSRGPQEIA